MNDIQIDRGAVFQSLAMQAVRAEWQDIGRRLRVPVVFFKGAWSEPVLHRGHSFRRVSDVDVLIPDSAWSAVTGEARRRGWSLHEEPGRRVSYERGREQTYSKGVGLAVDLHRAIAEPPRRLNPRLLIACSLNYESEDGPVLSFCPEHQIAVAAVNHANDGFLNDPRTRHDVELLLQRYDVDWHAVGRLAEAGHFSFGLRWMLAQLELEPPRYLRMSPRDEQRVQAVQSLRRRQWPPLMTQLAEGVLSGVPGQQLRWMVRYGGRRVLDRLPASWSSVG
ncbi:MAG: nucleotidyltransferase family protein [Myxococcota bacterium]